MRGKGGPTRLRVARPNPAAVPRRAGKAVSMQAPGTYIRTLQQGTFVVAAMAGQTCLDGQLVAIIGPPAIDAERKVFAMARPIIVDVQRGIGVFGDRRSKQAPRRVVDVEDNFEIEVVQGIDLLGRMIKGIGIEFERAVTRVPAIRGIAGAEVDEGVAREFLFAKGPSDLKRFLRPGEGAVGLKITERPFWGHHGPASEPDIFGQSVRR